MAPYASIIVHDDNLKMIDEDHRKNVKMHYTPDVGCTLVETLLRAQAEDRVVTGLAGAVQSLSKSPCDALFCVIAPPPAGDVTSHMQEVLLQAYCFENDIYIVKVIITFIWNNHF